MTSTANAQTGRHRADVVRVSHRDSTAGLARRGADIERLVLARAVKAFCEDRIMRDRNTTVVFWRQLIPGRATMRCGPDEMLSR
jgi:hypothetical protein